MSNPIGTTGASGGGITTPVSLANGGTGVALVDPGADRLLFWDDSAGQFTFLSLDAGLALSDTTLTSLNGWRNQVRNGNFPIWQRGTSITPTDNAYTADGWRGLVEGAGALTISQETSTVPTGAKNAAKLAVTATNNLKLGIFQVIEGINARQYRGRPVILTAKIRINTGETITKVRMAIVEFTGTEDSTTGDPISSWGAEGTNPTLAANWAYLTESGTPTDLSLSGNSFVTVSKTATVGASATNLAVFIWSENRTTTNTHSFYAADVELKGGSVETDFEARPIAVEQMICDRYYQRFTNTSGSTANLCFGGCYTTTNTFNTMYWRTRMRAAPTVTFSGGAGHFLCSDASGVGVAVTGTPTASGIRADGASFYGVVASGLVAGNASAFQFANTSWVSASAEL